MEADGIINIMAIIHTVPFYTAFLPLIVSTTIEQVVYVNPDTQPRRLFACVCVRRKEIEEGEAAYAFMLENYCEFK